MDNTQTLLGLIAAGPSHGYDLKSSYDRFFGSKKPLAYGQVYTTLSRLQRDDLIVALGHESGGGPERKLYQITSSGRDRVSQWLFTPDVPATWLQSNLFAKTVVALLLGDDANRLLDLQRAEHMEQLRQMTQAKRNADLMNVLLLDHALFQIEANLRWMDLTEARLAELRSEVVKA
ncbi:PadR family transcriptional regulator [Paenarthrobacter sp. NPDC091669]|uniref:PadR family transcriptional regulator n=1 Tax=Paenarthrobacter sp. NPDC091669 TaxID=3364384 RepID=UPI003818D8C1